MECDLGPLPGMLDPHKIHPVRFGVICEPSKGPTVERQTVGSVCMLKQMEIRMKYCALINIFSFLGGEKTNL